MILLTLVLVFFAVGGFVATSFLAARLSQVAPEVHRELGAPTPKTLFLYGRLPHRANGNLHGFIFRLKFRQVTDRQIRVLGWVCFISPIVTIVCMVILALLSTPRHTFKPSVSAAADATVCVGAIFEQCSRQASIVENQSALRPNQRFKPTVMPPGGRPIGGHALWHDRGLT